MRSIFPVVALALALLLSSSVASADDGVRWRRTTPRALLTTEGDWIGIRVPAGRAWGIASNPLAVEPGRTYRAGVEIEVPAERLRGAFLRIALYERADGRGRQRERLDSALVATGRGSPTIQFVAPAWARAAKLRVLIRAEGEMALPVRVSRGAVAPAERELPEVILRPND